MNKIILVVLLVVVLSVPAIAIYRHNTKPSYSATKIPYNNGFYAGPYKPELPVIDPTKKN